MNGFEKVAIKIEKEIIFISIKSGNIVNEIFIKRSGSIC